MIHRITFPDTTHQPVSLPEGTNLSEQLSILNSPLLFGCRTGICGTCLVQVEDGVDSLKAPDFDETEALEIYAPGNGKARLACQIFLNCPIALRKIESA
jgi:ferredoxin